MRMYIFFCQLLLSVINIVRAKTTAKIPVNLWRAIQTAVNMMYIEVFL